MKKNHIINILAVMSVAGKILAAEAPSNEPPAADKPTSAPAQPTETTPAATPVASTPEAIQSTGDTNMIRLNFRSASLESVLNYFSDAAGYIVNIKPGTSIKGKVDLWSSRPLTKDEALDSLDTVLNQNSLAAIHNGRTLTIINRDEAKTHDIPVKLEGDPDKIPRNDEMVTQIIPVRFVEVGQLVKDLQPLVSIQTTMTANEAGNAVIITDTQANIRRVAQVIKNIDSGAEAFTEVKVFRLVNADPSETADLLTNLFPDDSRTGGNGQGSVFSRFGGGGFRGLFGGGGPPGSGGNNGNSGNGANDQRIKKRARVIVVPEPRTGSVVVSAAKELMEQIVGVIAELDSDPHGKTSVSVMKVENADSQELQQVLQELFNKNNAQNTRNQNQQSSVLQNRSTAQNQQNNSGISGSRNGSSGRGGLGGSSIGP